MSTPNWEIKRSQQISATLNEQKKKISVTYKRGTLSVMVIIIGNDIGNQSSNHR